MLEPADFAFAQLTVGQTAEFDVVITDALVDAFADASGDHSPLHVDEEFAAQTPFGARIAHGMIGGAFFSQLVGMHLPGKHATYLSQELFFRRPMKIGVTVRVLGTIVDVSEASHTISIRTEMSNRETGELLTDGKALVRVNV